MKTKRSYLRRTVSVCVTAAFIVALVPALALASVEAACEPFTGSVPEFVATASDGGATLSWNAGGSTVRIIRSGSDYVMDADSVGVAAASVGAACWNYAPEVIYEGSESTFVDSGLENGYRYYYTAFRWNDDLDVWEEPSGTFAQPKGVAEMTPPIPKSYVKKGVPFAMAGSIGDGCPSKTTVQLVFYRRVAGVWVYWKSGTYPVAANTKYYRANVMLSASGSVKAVAKHADRDHVPSVSAPRYFFSHNR